MNRIWWLVILAVVIIGGLIGFFLTQGRYQAPQTITPVPEVAPQPQVSTNSATVSAQQAAESVTVDKVSLAESGYVVIHEETAGAPAKVVGASNLLQAGEYDNLSIKLSRVAKSGEGLYAMLHSDDGDGVYGFPDEDFPIKDQLGNIVLVRFQVL